MRLHSSVALPLASLALLSSLALGGCKKNDEAVSDTGANPPAGGSTTATPAPNPGPAASPGAAANSAAGSVSNAGVTAKIKNAINLSSAIDHKKSKINVDTTDTEVKLMGTVAPATGKAAAEKLAKANAGTRKVVDQLTVGAKAP